MTVRKEEDGTVYDEEAIPERDPDYRLPVETSVGSLTAGFLSLADRRELALELEKLGLVPWLARAIANL